MNLLEIFKPGTHTDATGRTITFTADDLKKTAAAYDPEKYEAPLVVGHPRTDAPAYGWTKSLSFAEDRLRAEPDQVEAQFAELVNAGRFKKISSKFWLPDAPGNPVPGVYYLHHIGFLGAAAPAVKGLKSASFAADEEGLVEFTGWSDRENAGLWRRFREWLIGKFGADEADKVVPAWAIETLEDEARSPEQPVEAATAYSAPLTEENVMTQEEIAAKEAEFSQREKTLNDREAAFAEREETIKKQELSARKAEHAAFCAGLVKEGKLLPKQQAFAVEFMAGLSSEQTVEFAGGDTVKKTSPLEGFKAFLSAMPKVIEFAEIAGGKDDLPTAGTAGEKLTVLTRQKMAENKELTYSAAFCEVQTEHPDLAQAYAAEITG